MVATVTLLRYWTTALATAPCTAHMLSTGPGVRRGTPILQIDVANNILYDEDASDDSEFATDPHWRFANTDRTWFPS